MSNPQLARRRTGCWAELEREMRQQLLIRRLILSYAPSEREPELTLHDGLMFMYFFCAVNQVTTSSRQVFAFARDKGLPFHKFLSKVNSNGVPSNSVYVTLAFTCILALIIIGSTTAFNIILSVSATGLFTSYLTVIGTVLGPVSNNNDVSDLKYGRQKRVGCTLGQTLRRTAANTALYAQAIRDLGEELQIPVLDIHRSMLAHAGHDHLTSPFPGSMDRPTNPTLQSFLTDGLHLSGEGYRLMYGELMTLIEQNWPGGMPDRLPLMLPAWNFQPTWKVDGGIQEPEWEDGGWSGPLRERGGNPPVGSEREMLVTGQFTEVLKWVKK
ncbi:hypothetical protein LTR01_008793 [Friedmanniomyces endolithicus]|nr:hypothetical protein LTR01_008793 [Friedmanniomyces endolithicus]